jgi:hypothetical protein
MESENRPKSHGISHGKSRKFKENLEKSGNFPLGQKFKIFKLNIKYFKKKACGAFPLTFLGGSAYCIFYLNEGVILLIKYLRPLIFWKNHGIVMEFHSGKSV